MTEQDRERPEWPQWLGEKSSLYTQVIERLRDSHLLNENVGSVARQWRTTPFFSNDCAPATSRPSTRSSLVTTVPCGASLAHTCARTPRPTTWCRRPGSAWSAGSTASRAARRCGPGSSASSSTARGRAPSATPASLPFSALEDDGEPAVEPAPFAADGRWTSAPPRLDGDPETGPARARSCARTCSRPSTGSSPAQRAVITLRDLVGLSAAEVCDCSTSPTATSACCCTGPAPASATALRAARGGAPLMRLWPRRRHGHDELRCKEFVELVTDYLEGRLPAEDAPASRRTSPSATAAAATSRTCAGSSARCTRRRSRRPTRRPARRSCGRSATCARARARPACPRR